MRLFLYISALFVTLLSEKSYSTDRRVWYAVAAKSLLTSGTVLPFGLSMKNMYVGGFANFSAQSTGDYRGDVERGQFGYGGLLGYSLNIFDIEASARTIRFDNKVNIQTQEQPSSSESILYGLGLRKLFWGFLTVKAGWAFHEIKSVAQNLPTGEGDVAKEYEDNGYYWGGGLRFPFIGMKLYWDATTYHLDGLSTNIVDSEIGFLYQF